MCTTIRGVGSEFWLAMQIVSLDSYCFKVVGSQEIVAKPCKYLVNKLHIKIVSLSIVSLPLPYREGQDYRGNWPYLIMKFCPYSGEFNFYIFSYVVDFFHLKIEQLQTHVVHWFNTETHDMIYSTYCACVHFNDRCYTMDRNPNIVPGDRWGFSGDLIWKAIPEVVKSTKVPGIIPTYPVWAYNW